jgi:hypothetical protein
MSATNRGAQRLPDDFYETPAWCVQAVLPFLQSFSSVLDPCAGRGTILRALPNAHVLGMGIEINPVRAKKCANEAGYFCRVGDALDPQTSWNRPNFLPPDLICTNPPYSLAQGFIERSLTFGAKQVAMLLRLNYLGSQKRGPWWRRNPCDVYVLEKRPSFARFLSCKKTPVEYPHGPCGWHDGFALNDPFPSKCPVCRNPALTQTTSDATEYAWFVWDLTYRSRCAKGGGHIRVLECP